MTEHSDFFCILDQISDLVFFLSPDFRFIWANRAYREYMRIGEKNIAATPLNNIVSEEYAAALEKKFREITPKNPCFDNIYPSILEDGSIIVEGWHNEGHFDKENKLIYYHCTASLADPDIISNTLIKSALIGTMIAFEGKVYYINRKFYELTGQPAYETLDGITLRDVLEPIFPESYREILDPKDGTEAINFEKKVSLPDGNCRWLSIIRKFRKYKNKNSELFLFEDITERKVNEIKTMKAKNMIEKVMRIAQIGYWEKNYIENCWNWSEETYRIFETKSGIKITEELLAGIIDPEYMKKRRKHIENTENADKSISYNYEYRIFLDSGREKWIHGTSFFEKGTGGDPDRYYGWVQDVTERKLTEKNLRAAKEKAEESERLKTAFLANMSHEIRTPLNAILGFSELLTSVDSPEEKTKFMGIINQSSNLLLKIVDDILDFSLIESGSFDLYIRKNNVNKILNEIENIFSGREQKYIQFIIHKTLPELFVKADKERLKQVLINLVNNAFKYTINGTITVDCFSTDNGEKIRFSVKDTGVGIKPDQIKLIFNRFYQIDSFSKGTGLGLSISKAIIEQMGGTISVESEHGNGSEFSVILPSG